MPHLTLIRCGLNGCMNHSMTDVVPLAALPDNKEDFERGNIDLGPLILGRYAAEQRPIFGSAEEKVDLKERRRM